MAGPLDEKETIPRTLPKGVHRVLQASHRGASQGVPHLREDPSSEPAPQVADERRIPEVTPEEMEGEWLSALFWHHPEEAPFPGSYAVVVQPFVALSETTGFQDPDGRPLTYLLAFVMGAVGVGASLPQELVEQAFRDTVRRATSLAKEFSQGMGDAPVRVVIARMPEWMARRLVPSMRSVRPV